MAAGGQVLARADVPERPRVGGGTSRPGPQLVSCGTAPVQRLEHEPAALLGQHLIPAVTALAEAVAAVTALAEGQLGDGAVVQLGEILVGCVPVALRPPARASCSSTGVRPASVSAYGCPACRQRVVTVAISASWLSGPVIGVSR